MALQKRVNSWKKYLDRNNDGSVNIRDFLSVFDRPVQTIESKGFISDKATHLRTKNSKHLDNLSDSIRRKVSDDKALSKKSKFSLADRKISSILNRLGLAFNDKDLEKMRLNYVNSLQNIKQLEENLSDLKAHENLADGKEREKIFKEIDKTELNLKKEIENKDQIILEFLKILSDYSVVISSDKMKCFCHMMIQVT